MRLLDIKPLSIIIFISATLLLPSCKSSFPLSQKGWTSARNKSFDSAYTTQLVFKNK
jgi:hypothetical protein